MTRPSERRCAICGKAQQAIPSRGGIAAFTLPLRSLGLTGSYAHASCLRKAQLKARKNDGGQGHVDVSKM